MVPMVELRWIVTGPGDDTMGRTMKKLEIDDSVSMKLSYRQCAIIFSWANYISKFRKRPPFDREEYSVKMNVYGAMRRMIKRRTSS